MKAQLFQDLVILQRCQSHVFGEPGEFNAACKIEKIWRMHQRFEAWPIFDEIKDLSKISREQYDCSSNWPSTSGEISHCTVPCVDVAGITHHRLIANDQVKITKVSSQLILGWDIAGIRMTAWNRYFEGRLGTAASTKKLRCHCWYGNGIKVLFTELKKAFDRFCNKRTDCFN